MTVLDFFDTATEPTAEMLEAMTRAKLGDDVYHSDPTVLELERLGAARLGHEDAIFMPSGTMSNLCAVMAGTRRGDEVIAEASSHIFYAEAGGMAVVASAMPRTIASPDGILTAEIVKKHLRGADQHFAPTSMICVENTHNRAGGTVTDAATMQGLRTLCDERGLHLHVDGARIFNAAVALGIDVSELTDPADSVSVCLSKGLSAPAGALLAGRSAFVERARRARKMLGGSMRQAGLLAAAGIVALESGVERLAEDHERARRMAHELSAVPGLRVENPSPVTNFVLVDVSPSGRTAGEVVAALADHGISAGARPPSGLRFVTHRQTSDSDVDIAVKALGTLLA